MSQKTRMVFTTGQVAKICQVAPRTVSKWFDSGKLKGYRIPGSQDRRIPRDQLIRFLKDNGMPLGNLEQESYHKILIVGAEPLFIERLQDLLAEDDGLDMHQIAVLVERAMREDDANDPTLEF